MSPLCSQGLHVQVDSRFADSLSAALLQSADPAIAARFGTDISKMRIQTPASTPSSIVTWRAKNAKRHRVGQTLGLRYFFS
jgi:hypothetical protein